MNTKQINENLKNYKCFIGTFARNHLPTKLPIKRKYSLIMNTDTSNLPGQHWVALFIENNNSEYFDSYGLPPLHKEVYSYLENNKIEKLVYNTNQIQGVNSNTCGNYCILFIKLRCQNITFDEIIKLNFNDKNIRNI